MNRKNVAILGIILCSIYFIATFKLILTGAQIWLIAMELVTMASGIFMIMLVLTFPFSKTENFITYKIIACIFSAACMVLTNVAHMVNLTVTEQLLKNGVSIPDYLRIGKWPSVEMAIDYLAWGLFMGLAFIFSSFGIDKEKTVNKLKTILFICGCLCLVGFFCAILINENLWYIAPMGYGFGTLIICIELLIINKKLSQLQLNQNH